MTINTFLLQIVILLMPGFLWAKIDLTYSSNKEKTDTIFFIRSFIFALITYFFLFVVLYFYNLVFSNKTSFLLENINDKLVLKSSFLLQIGLALLFSFCFSGVWLYLKEKKWLTQIFIFLHLTTKFGEEDIWDYALSLKKEKNKNDKKNPPPEKTKIISIKDFEKNIIITGYLESFSDTDKIRELSLYKVTIAMMSTGDILYKDLPRIYIALPSNNIIMEILFQTEIDTKVEENEK